MGISAKPKPAAGSPAAERLDRSARRLDCWLARQFTTNNGRAQIALTGGEAVELPADRRCRRPLSARPPAQPARSGRGC